MSPKRPLTRRKKLAGAIFVSLVVLGAAELALRLAGYRYDAAASMASTADAGEANELGQSEFYAPDPDLLWTLRPSTVIDAEGFGFCRARTNSDGLRGPALPGAKAPGEFRVLCLGDSVTFGLCLEDGLAPPRLLEDALRAAPEFAGRTVRVINAGVPGYSSVQGMRLLERLLHLEPDVVIFWFGMNDAGPMRGLPDRALKAGGAGGSLVSRSIGRLRLFQLVQNGVVAAQRAAAEGTRATVDDFRAAVERLGELERSGGPKAVFVREPERCAVTIAQLERVVARAEEEDVKLVFGPARLLRWVVPAPEGADLAGTRITAKTGTGEDIPAIVFAADATLGPDYGEIGPAKPLEVIRADLEALRRRKAALDRLSAELPASSLGYDDLFPGVPPDRVFMDNCHLSPEGARRAAKSLAKVVLESVR